MERAFRFLDQCSPIASSRQGLIDKVTMLFIAYFRSEAEAIIQLPLLLKIATPFHLAGWFELFGRRNCGVCTSNPELMGRAEESTRRGRRSANHFRQTTSSSSVGSGHGMPQRNLCRFQLGIL